MNTHQTKIKVRYGETDQMGVVYHGNYAQYLEIGRLEWLNTLGISYKEMEADNVMLPVVSLSLKVHKTSYLRRNINDIYFAIEVTNCFHRVFI